MGSEDMAKAEAAALECSGKLPGKRHATKKLAKAVAKPTKDSNNMTVDCKNGTTRLSHYSTKSYIQYKVEKRWCHL